MKDYYLVLGVNRGADTRKIKKAYRRIAKKYHPDISGSKAGAEKLIEVREAYETLADETRREKYDEELKRQAPPLKVSAVSDISVKRQSIRRNMDFLSSFADAFFDGCIFDHLPGEQVTGHEKELCYEIVMTSAEARRGGLFPITLPVIDACPRCRKTGFWDGFFCPVCKGSGIVHTEREFSLRIPPDVQSGTKVSLSMKDIDLIDTLLRLVFTVEPD